MTRSTLIASSGKKGWLPAYRDAVMFKVAYSYGLRFNELRHLQTVDFSRNPHAREFGRYGVVQVRYGKAKKGSPPKRRSVLTVFDWTPEIIADWLAHGQPDHRRRASTCSPASAALWSPKRPCCDGSGATATISSSPTGWICIRSAAPTSPTSSKTAGTPSSSRTRWATSTPAPHRCIPVSPATTATRTLRRVLDRTIKDALSLGEETS